MMIHKFNSRHMCAIYIHSIYIMFNYFLKVLENKMFITWSSQWMLYYMMIVMVFKVVLHLTVACICINSMKTIFLKPLPVLKWDYLLHDIVICLNLSLLKLRRCLVFTLIAFMEVQGQRHRNKRQGRLHNFKFVLSLQRVDIQYCLHTWDFIWQSLNKYIIS